MKKKLFVLVLACVSLLLFGITGCGKHTHTFEEKWTYDATYHWHAATCKHTDEVGDKAEHSFGEWQVEKNATYTETGLKKRTCSVCNYEETETIAKLSQVEGTFVLNTVTKEYDGTAVAFVKGTDYTLPGDYNGTEKIKVYSDAEKTTEVSEIKNAGKYYIVATLTATDKYKAYTSESIEFTVTKAANEWTVTPGISGWTYDGTASAPVGTAKFGDVVFEYAVKGTDNWSTTKPVNAGEYQLKASVAGTTDYTEISKTVDFAISNTANEWTVTPNITGWTYDGTASEPVGTAKYGTVVFEYAVKGTDNWSTTKPVNAGEYQLRASVAGTTDYTEISKTVDFAIAQATNEWTTEPTIEGWTYGDTPNVPSVAAKFGNENIKYTYEVYVTGTMWAFVPSITSTSSVGTYRVTAAIAETDNYTGLTKTVTFKITKATNEWTTELTIEGWTYGDTPNLPVAAAKFGNETITYTYKHFVTKSGGFWEDTSAPESTSAVGRYSVTAAIAGTDNYTGLTLTETVTFNITKATNEWTITPSIANWMYGNEPSTPAGVARFGEVTFKYGTSTDVSLATETVPKNAGTYYLFASVAGTSNYDALQSDPIEFKINTRGLKAVKTSRVYDGVSNSITVNSDGFEDLFGGVGVIPGDEVSITFVMTSKDVGATYKGRTNLEGEAAANYNIITWNPPQITPRTLNNFDIDGSPDGTNSGPAAGQYAGMWYYECTLETRDTSCLISGDEVKVKIWFANENDLSNYMEAPEITLVDSMDLVEAGTAYIVIFGGEDGNNYQIGDTDLGTYVPGN